MLKSFQVTVEPGLSRLMGTGLNGLDNWESGWLEILIFMSQK